MSYWSTTYTLSPGGHVVINHPAQTFGCLDADHKFRVKVGNASTTDFEKGLSFTADSKFSQVRIENPDATKQLIVTVFFAAENVRDARLVLPHAMEARTTPASSLLPKSVEVQTNQRVRLSFAHDKRKSVIVHNFGTQQVFIGDSTVTFGTGLPLAPGERYEVDAKCHVWAYNQSSEIQTISVLETYF